MSARPQFGAVVERFAPRGMPGRLRYARHPMGVWGVHGLEGVDFLQEGVIVLDRPRVGDLLDVGEDRNAIKHRLAIAYPRESPGTIAAWAGVLRRFAFDPVIGDLVVHPNRTTRTVSVGAIDSGYTWDANDGSEACRD